MSGLKNKITSHLPGHKNQDKNMNGVPDRFENNPSNRNGALGTTYSTTTTTSQPFLGQNQGFTDLNRDGIPDQLQGGQGFNQTLPLNQGLNQGQGFTDFNRNGIPDQLEGQGQWNNGIQGQGFNQGLNQGQWNSGTQGFTDYNRNGIPDQLEGQGFNQGQQGFGFIGSTTVNSASVVNVTEAPVIVQKIEKPAVVHEVYKTEEVVQIQPIIERERDTLDVYEVVQPIREREVMATEVRQAVLPAQTRSTIVEDNSAFLAQRSAPTGFSTREVAATMTQTVQNAPIIHETIVHKVVEEIQPVIYKEIDRPILIKETLPVYEKVVEAPHAHQTVLPMRDLGVRSVTGFTNSYAGGYQTTGLNSGIQSQGTFQQGGLTDFNGNGVPDQYEGRQGFNQGLNQGQWNSGTQGLTDFNRNGIPDQLEGQGFNQGLNQGQWNSGTQGLTDYNRNGIPDQLEGQGLNQGLNQGQWNGQQGFNQGLNQGHVAPRTLSDLNGNGIPDRMEKAHGLKDLNGNGVDDTLERRMRTSNLGSQTY